MNVNFPIILGAWTGPIPGTDYTGAQLELIDKIAQIQAWAMAVLGIVVASALVAVAVRFFRKAR